MSTIRAALFDLDGTLQDSEVLWVEATRDYVRGLGVEFSDEDAFSVVYGRSWRSIHAEILARKPSCAVPMDRMSDEVRGYFLRLRDASDIAIPGSVGLARGLAGAGLGVAVVSGSVRADVESGVRALGLSGAVRFVLGAEDYGEGKPDPGCYLAAAARMGVPPDACVVFEDSAAGVTAARRAGMYAVGLARPGRPAQDLSPADLVFQDLSGFSLDQLPSSPGGHCRRVSQIT